MTAPFVTSIASATSESGVPLILALTLSRPGRASGRVVMSTPSTSSPSMRQVAGGVTLSSRARTAPRVRVARSIMMVFVEGLALGSGGGIRSSRSEKSKRSMVKRVTCMTGAVRMISRIRMLLPSREFTATRISRRSNSTAGSFEPFWASRKRAMPTRPVKMLRSISAIETARPVIFARRVSRTPRRITGKRTSTARTSRAAATMAPPNTRRRRFTIGVVILLPAATGAMTP